MSVRLRSDRRGAPRRGRGSVLVELALMLPLLVLLVLATIEFAQALSAYKVLTSQVRAATRYLTTLSPGTGDAEAACIVKHGDPTCSGALLLPGFGASFTALVTDSADPSAIATHRAQNTGSGGTSVNLVTVTASSYQHPLIFGGFLNAIVGSTASITFNPISVTMRQIS